MKPTSKKRTPSIVNLTVTRRYLTQREVESPVWRRWHLARLALPRADCGAGLHHQPVRLAFRVLMTGWRWQCDGLRGSFDDDFGFIPSARREHPSDVLNRRV